MALYRKLNRDSSARKALFRSMLTSFFQHERIETTETKAKVVSGLADQMITLAKRGDCTRAVRFWHTSWMKK